MSSGTGASAIIMTTWLAAAVVAGQSAKPRAVKPVVARSASGNDPMPRTADGHPDLQGIYDIATLTPLESGLPGVHS